jgi:hypothetical protein
MRISPVIALIVLLPSLALADVRWHKFGVSGSDKDTVTLGRISVTVQTREVQGSAFREDYLMMTVRAPGQKAIKYWFESSYAPEIWSWTGYLGTSGACEGAPIAGKFGAVGRCTEFILYPVQSTQRIS